MRFLIFSDSHGRRDDMTEILSRQKSLDGVFHLGDGRQDLIGLLPLSGEIPLFAAVGNCDREPDRDYETVELGGVKILYTHGHRLYVKYGTEHLLAAARREEASVALFGHTHEPMLRYEDGIYLMNPGSVGMDRRAPYGALDIQNGQILPSLHTLR